MDAVHGLLASGGIGAITLRAVANRSGVSASGLLTHFQSRDRLLMVASRKTGERRIDDIARRSRRDQVLAFVPTTEDEVADARVWLAFCELGRSDADVGHQIAELRIEERLLIDVLLDRSLDGPELDLLIAVIEGLTVAVCAPRDPLPPERARAVLAGYLGERLRPAS